MKVDKLAKTQAVLDRAWATIEELQPLIRALTKRIRQSPTQALRDLTDEEQNAMQACVMVVDCELLQRLAVRGADDLGEHP